MMSRRSPNLLDKLSPTTWSASRICSGPGRNSNLELEASVATISPGLRSWKTS